MNKTILSLVSMMFSVNAFATTLVHIPLFVRDENNEKVYSMDQINLILKDKGLKTFPEYFEFTDQNTRKIDYKSIYALYGAIEDEMAKAGLQDYVHATEDVPNSLSTKTAHTCFIGDGTKVQSITNRLGDLFYSEQMSFHGWKYKSHKELYQGNEEIEQFLEEGSETWKNWDVRSPNVLILNSVGDDGDDIQESVVPPCK